MKAKKKKWVKFRHRVIRTILYLPVKLYCRLKFGVKIFKHKKRGAYLILSNHQTDGDQFFTYLAFKNPVYLLATEDLFSNGFKSRLLEYAFAPVPFDKTSTDIQSIRNCIKVAKEGGSLCVFPEGNRTYSGRTEHIKPSIVKLVKLLKLPVAIFKIDGGYGVQPRWARGGRKGKISAKVTSVIYPEQYLSMDNDELYALIKDGLSANEAIDGRRYKGKRRAEYIERAVYVCPHCGFSEWESKNNQARCTKCNLTVTYGEDKTITAINGEIPFSNTAEWIDYQNSVLLKVEPNDYTDKPAFTDRARLLKVKPYKVKRLIDKNAFFSLYSDRITILTKQEKTFYFKDLQSLSVLGRNKLNFNTGEELYQVKGGKRFNALKYVNFFYNYRIKTEGDSDDFLGI